MEEFNKALKNLDQVVKIILHILLGGWYGGLYRISLGDTKNIVMGVIWILTGGFFIVGWVFDLISIIKKEDLSFLID